MDFCLQPAVMASLGKAGAIVHWACIDFRHAECLVRDIEINRGLAMRRGGPPDPGVSVEASRERRLGRVKEFHMDQPGRGARVPLPFGEERAPAKLVGLCGLLRQPPAGQGGFP